MCKVCFVRARVCRARCVCVPTGERACPSQDSQTSRDDAHVPNDEYVRAEFITRTETSLAATSTFGRASGYRTLGDVHSPPNIGGDVSLQLSNAQAPRLHGEHLPATKLSDSNSRAEQLHAQRRALGGAPARTTASAGKKSLRNGLHPHEHRAHGPPRHFRQARRGAAARFERFGSHGLWETSVQGSFVKDGHDVHGPPVGCIDRTGGATSKEARRGGHAESRTKT